MGSNKGPKTGVHCYTGRERTCAKRNPSQRINTKGLTVPRPECREGGSWGWGDGVLRMHGGGEVRNTGEREVMGSREEAAQPFGSASGPELSMGHSDNLQREIAGQIDLTTVQK